MQRTWCAQVTQSRSFKPISGGGGHLKPSVPDICRRVNFTKTNCLPHGYFLANGFTPRGSLSSRSMSWKTFRHPQLGVHPLGTSQHPNNKQWNTHTQHSNVKWRESRKACLWAIGGGLRFFVN